MITLTVDGNLTDRKKVSDILAGIDPNGDHIKAENGGEAIDIADRYQLDIVFMDTALPDADGIEIAERILMRQTQTNIIFITNDTSCAMRAFEIYASGYLQKPVTEQDIRQSMRNLRYSLKNETEGTNRLKVRCFGTFEAYINDVPVTFERTKTKQLLAYLIDRQGDICEIPQMVCALWPESDGGSAATNYLRRLISDLQSVLNVNGVGDAITRSWGKLQINMDKVDCDYYDYLSGKPGAAAKFKGEYMSQYSLGEMTLAKLTMGDYMDLSSGQETVQESVKENKLKVKCFGDFEVYMNGEPLIFARRKSKELFAYLIDKKGGAVAAEELARELWPEDEDINVSRHKLRTVIYELYKDLEKAGMSQAIVKKHRHFMVNKEMIDCDYWKILSGEQEISDMPAASYLKRYSWASPSREALWTS